MSTPAIPLEDVEPLTDPGTLRDSDLFRAETDTAPAEAVETVAGLEDMAAVAVERDAAVLLRRLTETCAWKLPVASVPEGADYAETAREQVRESLGPIDVRTVESVRRVEVRAADGDRTATRTFVVLGGVLAGGVDPSALPLPAEGAHEAGWFEALPDDAEEVPGTRRLFDRVSGRP